MNSFVDSPGEPRRPGRQLATTEVSVVRLAPIRRRFLEALPQQKDLNLYEYEQELFEVARSNSSVFADRWFSSAGTAAESGAEVWWEASPLRRRPELWSGRGPPRRSDAPRATRPSKASSSPARPPGPGGTTITTFTPPPRRTIIKTQSLK